MTAISIRRFDPADGDDVISLHRVDVPDAPPVPDDPAPDLDDVEGHYLDDDGEFLVGTVDGEVVATAAYAPVSEWKREHVDGLAPNARELTRCYVHPDRQRQGYGSAIYDRLEGRARDDGVASFVLTTGAENAPARSFFESQGFEGLREVTVESEGTPLHLALYRKRLAE